jgi:hypothetical protein
MSHRPENLGSGEPQPMDTPLPPSGVDDDDYWFHEHPNYVGRLANADINQTPSERGSPEPMEDVATAQVNSPEPDINMERGNDEEGREPEAVRPQGMRPMPWDGYVLSNKILTTVNMFGPWMEKHSTTWQE